MSEAPARSVWRNRDFRLFWSGHSVAQIGAQVSEFALPLIVLQLGAASALVGFLRAAALLPQLALSLPVGNLVDRRRRVPLMIISDVGRCIVTLALLLAASCQILNYWQLLVAVLLLGSGAVLFDICYQSVLPSLLPREQLGQGNVALEATRSFATLAGPALAGVLIGLMPVWAVLSVDAFAYAVSAITLFSMRAKEPRPAPPVHKEHLLASMAVGMRQVWRSPVLRPTMLFISSRNLFAGVFATYALVFQVRELGIPVAQAAVVELIGNGGFLLGVMAAGRVFGRVGVGWTLFAGAMISALGMLIFASAAGPLSMPIVVLGLICYGFGVASNNLQNVTLRQSITPPEILGRVNAALRLTNYGTLPLGALLGGVLTGALGLRPTMIIAAIGALVTTAFLGGKTIRSIRETPTTESVWGIPTPVGADR